MTSNDQPTADRDAEQLRSLGYVSHFDRTISMWENFALGFTYLSPVVGVYTQPAGPVVQQLRDDSDQRRCARARRPVHGDRPALRPRPRAGWGRPSPAARDRRAHRRLRAAVICSVIKHGTQTPGMDPYELRVWPQRGVTRWGTRAIRDKRSRGTAEAVPALGGLCSMRLQLDTRGRNCVG